VASPAPADVGTEVADTGNPSDSGVDAGGTDTGSSAVVYTDVNPDKVVSTWSDYELRLDHAPGSYGEPGTFSLWFHDTPEVVINAFDEAEVLSDSGGLPLALAKGDAIGDAPATGKWSLPAYAALNGSGATGNWIGVKDKYLGLRFKKDGKWAYGWARLDVDAPPTNFVLKDYAYASTPNTGLKAGDGSP